MDALEHNKPFQLRFDGKVYKTIDPQKLWNLIVHHAWLNGEPGVVFIDTIDRANPTPQLGKITCTNPCGEQPLLPDEACNLASINLSKFVGYEQGIPTILYDKLEHTIEIAVRFLDDVITVNNYPLPVITGWYRRHARLVLG